jgi:hypothetical protein
VSNEVSNDDLGTHEAAEAAAKSTTFVLWYGAIINIGPPGEWRGLVPSQEGLKSSDQSNIWFSRTVWPNFYCLVRPNDRTFFCRTQNFFSLLYIAFFKSATLDILSLKER